MRFVKVLAVAALVLALATMTFAVKAPKSDVNGSMHDLRTWPGATSVASYGTCNECHIAHKFGASPSGPGALLWNHALSSVASYGVYSSPSFDTVVTDASEVAGSVASTNMCLSCHDGTVALNSNYESISNNNATDTMTTLNSGFVVRDLSKQHPVNFTYDATLANKVQMLVPASAWGVDAAGDMPLYGGKMQCGTCHDPHAGKSHLFFRPNMGCTYCHR